MSRVLTPHAFASTLGVLTLLACGGSYQGASAPEPAAPASPTPRVLTATCKAYDVGAGTMDVITGVSFALREITFKIHENTEITIRNKRAELADMRAGMVLRIGYRVTSQGNLADRIELVLDATGLR